MAIAVALQSAPSSGVDLDDAATRALATVEQVPDAACRVRVGSWSWAGVTSWALRFDAPFTVLGPQAFIDSLSGLGARVSGASPGSKSP